MAASQRRDEEYENQAKEWIEAVTGMEFEAETFEDSLKDGVIVCELINKLKPGSVKKINKSKLMFKQLENISNYIKACREFGVPEMELFSTNDLYEAKNIPQVTLHFHALGRTVQSVLPDWTGPTLGHKVVEKKERKFTEAQLRAARNETGLLYYGSSAAGREKFDAARTGQVEGALGGLVGKMKVKTRDDGPAPAPATATEVDSETPKDTPEEQTPKQEESETPKEPETATPKTEEKEPEKETPATSSSSSDLPKGWEELKTEDGRTYYFNEEKEITQWERPTASAASGGEESALPSGWEEMTTDDGRKYYVHGEKGITQWERPVEEAKKDEALLPPGWEELKTDDGRTYFFNEEKEITQWERPVADESKIPPLPEGWEELKTDDGRTYYVNEAKNVTQWERPTE